MTKSCATCANCTDYNLYGKGYRHAYCLIERSSIGIIIEYGDKINYKCSPNTSKYWAPKPLTKFAKFLLLFSRTKRERWLNENFDI